MNPVDTREGIAGEARFQRLSAVLNRLYLAALDAAPETQPDRGLVAVINVREGDCGAHFDHAIGPCAACEDDDHCVTLAHLPGYVADTPMQNEGEGDEDDLHIDNLTHRPLVPSSNTIVDVVRCMLEQGVAQGRLGPRGPAGAPGRDCRDGIDGQDGQDGADGQDGQDGADGQDGEGLSDDLTHIVGLSWLHDRISYNGFGDFEGRMREIGIVLEFDRAIGVRTVLGTGEGGPDSRVFELLARAPAFGGIVEVIVPRLVCEPCELTGRDGDGRIVSVDGLPSDTEFARAMRLRLDGEFPDDPDQRKAATYRVVFRSDFVRNEADQAVDGNHVFGAVPERRSGDRLPGGTFESWFYLAQ